MLYYTTKYWETRGMEPIEFAPEGKSKDGRYIYTMRGIYFDEEFIVGRNAFLTKAEAVAAVKKAGERKVMLLEKTIARIRKYLAELS